MGVEPVPNYMEEDVSITDSQLVYRFRLALRSKSVPSGDTDGYKEIVSVMDPGEYLDVEQAAYLSTAMKALSGAVSDLDGDHHDQLLKAIFKMSLWKFRPNVMDALLELIISLAASNGKFVDSCLDMLINNFTPPNKILDKLTEPVGLERKGRVLPRIHAALKDLTELVPIAADRISSILLEHMPWNPKQKYDQLTMKRQLIFVENILKLERGAIREFVGNSVLRHLMIMLRDVDVSIGWDDILHDDSSKGIFSMELEDESYDDVDVENDELPSTLSQKSLSNNEMAEMLDSLMVQTFEHLDSAVADKRLFEVFDMLLSSFKDTVLTTYKSKFSQFVMFYACALDPENCGLKFANELMDMFVYDVNPLVRMSAVAYLASFLARAKFLPPDFVAVFLERLVDWCFQYCTNHDSDMNSILHKVFYSGCQAIMYVLCFRMQSIVGIPKLRSQLFCMPLDRIFKHRLDPLRVCLPSIVQEFLKQSKAAHLFTSSKTFVFEDLLGSDLSKSFGGLQRLDMFFPFDPCMLKKSDRNFLRPFYVYWKYVKTTYDEDTDLDEDDDEEGCSDDEKAVDDDYEVSYMEEGMARSMGDDLDMADNALSKMSITPSNSSSLKQRFGAEGLQMPSRIRPSMSPESL